MKGRNAQQKMSGDAKDDINLAMTLTSIFDNESDESSSEEELFNILMEQSTQSKISK